MSQWLALANIISMIFHTNFTTTSHSFHIEILKIIRIIRLFTSKIQIINYLTSLTLYIKYNIYLTKRNKMY